MSGLDLKHISSITNDYDIFLFDLWGVIIENGGVYPGVIDNVNKLIDLEKKVFFITNAPRTIDSLYQDLIAWGLNVTPEMIMSSGEVALTMIRESMQRFNILDPIVYNLSSDYNNILSAIDCHTTNDINEANILLLTLNRDESPDLNLDEFDDLLKTAVNNNIINLCANPDLGLMHKGGQRYCAGYFAAKIKQFGGEVIYTGKPYGEIYDKVFSRISDILTIPKNRILMIGDTFYTDVLAANMLGIDSGLVLTGNAVKYHEKYSTLSEKLIHLKIAATEKEVAPTFAIEIA